MTGSADQLLFTGDLDIIDGHVHPCLYRAQVSASDVISSFTEADDEIYVARHAGNTVTAAAGVRYLAGVLGVPATAEGLAAARNQLGLAGYTRKLLAGHQLRGLILDTGYPAGGLSLADCERVFAVPCREVVRVESVAESLIGAAPSARELIDQLMQTLAAVDRERVVAFKTIAAYRGGLQLGRPNRAELRAAFDAERRAIDQRAGRIRLTQPALIAAIVYAAFEVAQSLRMPVQIHTGFGDRDLTLAKSDPWLLQPLLDSGQFSGVPIAILHAGYPHVKKAGILAGLYQQVQVDISLAVPLVGHGCRNVILDLLEQAPISKLLYGSDGSVGPELVAWAARVASREVDAALRELVSNAWLTEAEARSWARHLFADNARKLYGLDGVM
ncbi:MAG: amidohydrolase family protein [Proteobacteria bacterium]|nr:amidohydrolase family protein [Pseudomonadota bacterium]